MLSLSAAISLIYYREGSIGNELITRIFPEKSGLVGDIIAAADKEIADDVFKTDTIFYPVDNIFGYIPEKFQLLFSDQSQHSAEGKVPQTLIAEPDYLAGS